MRDHTNPAAEDSAAIWNWALTLAKDPEGITLMADAHTPENSGRCRAHCHERWPCDLWLIATLAKVLHVRASRRQPSP